MTHPLPTALLRHGPTLAALSRALPNRFRLTDADGTIDGRVLRTSAADLAARWAAAGVGPGMRLAVIAEGRAAVRGLLAGSLTGADVMLLDPDGTSTRIASMITSSAVDVAARADPAPAVTAPIPVLPLDPASGGPSAPRRIGGRVLLHSSGTGGRPRTSGRARYGPRSLGPALELVRRLRLWRRDPLLITPPLHHGFGLGFLTLALFTGTPVVLGQRADPGRVLSLVGRHRVGTLITVPPTLQRLVEHPAAGSITPPDAILTGSGPLHPRLSEAVMDTFGDVLHNLYGTTEGGWCCLATPADLRAAPGTVGRAVLGSRVRVINTEVFVASPLATQSQTIFVPTGDLGHFDPAGRLLLDGRRDDLVVVGGVTVDLVAVEERLRALPGVRDAVVRGVDDPAFGHTLHADVVAASDPAPEVAELRRLLTVHLPSAAVPRSWSFVHAVHRTPFGSTRRRATS